MPDNVSITVKNGLCVSCGLCKAACPYGAIDAGSRKGVFQPLVNDKCVDCGLCLKVCPGESSYLAGKIKTGIQEDYHFGLNEDDEIFQGYETNKETYMHSASGGLLSALVLHLFSTKEIDAVIHAAPQYTEGKSDFYTARLSMNAEEYNQGRSSFYYPVHFDEIIRIALNENISSILVLGTPCVISGLRRFSQENIRLQEKLKYCFALVCSHNANALFSRRIFKYLKPDAPSKLNFRDKQNITQPVDFKNSITSETGKRKALSRFKTPFTLHWRSYSHALNACFFCPDFWGVDADASFKDAWGLRNMRKEGDGIAIIRHEALKHAFTEMAHSQRVSVKRLTHQQLIGSQINTLRYKHRYIKHRYHRNKALRHILGKGRVSRAEGFLHRLDYRIKQGNRKASDFWMQHFGWPLPPLLLKQKAWMIRKLDAFLTIIHNYKDNTKSAPEVIYTAGFGYSNIGDEAQLHTNLLHWKREAPHFRITLLSPNPQQTYDLHGAYDVLPASRISFWGYRGLEYAGLGSRKLFVPWFRHRLRRLRFNAFLITHFNTTFLLDPESATLLKRLKKADVLHIGGGGYLMGKTQSRLLDYLGLIHLADYLGTDVILSGHNIGDWRSGYQKRLARKQLKKAMLIGLRDNKDSVQALKEAGVYHRDTVFPLFDDALFCDDISEDELNDHLQALGIKKEDKYITVNVHYWIVPEKKVNACLDEMAEVLSQLTQKGYRLLFIPMDHKDRYAMEYLFARMNETHPVLEYNMQCRILVAAYRKAHMCITMKHHPIIFSMSGNVPVLSVAFESYYNHKNTGALGLFGQEHRAIVYGEGFKEKFESELFDILRHRDTISGEIMKRLKEHEKGKAFIIQEYLNRKKYANRNH